MTYRTRCFLLNHIKDTLNFYDKSIDPAGGYYPSYKDDGTIYNRENRHLISTTRFIYNYSMGYIYFKDEDYLKRTHHGLQYLRNVHRNCETGGYAWQIDDGQVTDDTNHCYGLAFVLLAYSCSFKAGIQQAKEWIQETFDLMEKYFWFEDKGLYACEATGDWKLKDYRGQNDNMHACEALLVAYQATNQLIYLDKAKRIAEVMTQCHEQLNNQIWEHYHVDWTPDFQYNQNVKTDRRRPWGIQTGHQTEWAKLLLILDRYDHQQWHIERAKALFDRAIQYGWDQIHGGLIYGYDIQGNLYDGEKYFWVQAESFAAAALLAHQFNDENGYYWQIYEQIWNYVWKYFVDHQYGAWFRLLKQNNEKYSDEKSPVGKTDYHTMGACYEVLNVII